MKIERTEAYCYWGLLKLLRFSLFREISPANAKRQTELRFDFHQLGTRAYAAFLHTNLLLDYLCHKKTEAVLVRWRYEVKLVSCDWSSVSCGNLIRGKFNLN